MVEKDFKLVEGLAKKDFIIDLKFSKVLFENNKFYPWVFLVPMKANVKNMLDLTTDERILLMREIEIVEKVMFNLFKPDQTNVAMIGNMTPQLHVHILCRKKGDPDWPNTVWNNAKEPYMENEKQKMIEIIRDGIKNAVKNNH